MEEKNHRESAQKELGRLREENRELRQKVEIQHIYKGRVLYLDQVLQALSAVNRLINRERDREALLKGICSILYQVKEYRLAWIGLINNKDKRVWPVAWSGLNPQYLDEVVITWDETPLGKGPTGSSIKKRKPVVMRDILKGDSYSPWREKARERGYRSSAAVPLIHGDQLFGALNVYSSKLNAFDDDEIELLCQIAEDTAYALYSLEEEERRKKAESEKEKMEKLLLQNQRMEALGRLAGGVAHDFSNLLNAVSINAHVIEKRIERGEPAEKPLSLIAKIIEKGARLTQQLLLFSRRQPMAMEEVDLNETIEGITEMAGSLLEEGIELRLMLAENLPFTRGNKANLEQVLINVIVNGRDAIRQGDGTGVVTLKTSRVSLEEGDSRLFENAKGGTYVLLEICDTGSGMDRETADHLFEPFFSTKAESEGRGIGLSVTLGVVREFGGWISVNSEWGEGTCFSIYFPATQRSSGE